jgi:hypothetical protein
MLPGTFGGAAQPRNRPPLAVNRSTIRVEDLNVPTNVKSGTMVLPFSLGAVGPGAGFAGASVPLTQNFLPVKEDGISPDNAWSSVTIQALPGNGADVFLCNSAAPPDLVAFTNVIAVIPAGQYWPRNRQWSNSCSLASLFIGAVNAVDGCLVVIDAF